MHISFQTVTVALSQLCSAFCCPAIHEVTTDFQAAAGVMMQPQSMSLIMEYVPHGNLFKSIQQDSKGTLQWWDRGRHVALDIAKGLAYLHSRKVTSKPTCSSTTAKTAPRPSSYLHAEDARCCFTADHCSADHFSAHHFNIIMQCNTMLLADHSS